MADFQLRVGRVGWDAEKIRLGGSAARSQESEWQESISGSVIGATFEEAKAIRSELLAQVGKVVAVTWAFDPFLDAFYYLQGVSVEASHREVSLQDPGNFPFELNLERFGTSAEVEIESLMTHAVLSDSLTGGDAHGIDSSEAQFGHSPSIGALAYSIGVETSTAHTRDTADGIIPFIYYLPDISPRWSVEPSGYLLGAVNFTHQGFIRAGHAISNDVTTWQLSNGLLRITPGVDGGGLSNGQILFEVWDGTAWSTPTAFEILYNATTSIPRWHYISIERNTPEGITIALTRDAEESPATTHRHVLFINLRRGYLIADCYFVWVGPPVDWKVQLDSAQGSSTVTPTGADNAVGIRASANDASGDRFVMFSSRPHTADIGQGGLTLDSGDIPVGPDGEQVWDFAIGYAPNGSGAATGDNPDSLALQYHGFSEENVRIIKR